MELTAVILAGGSSRRLGRDKVLELIEGKSLFERVVERVQLLTDKILIVTSREETDLRIGRGFNIHVDIYPGKGPLGGIYTGLVHSSSFHNLFVACDMPFLNTELLNYMVKLSSDFDAVVPRLEEGKLEPLHAIYTKECLSSVESQLRAGNLEAYSFFDMVRVRYVELAESERFDPELLSFFNINRQVDLDKAVSCARGERALFRR